MSGHNLEATLIGVTDPWISEICDVAELVGLKLHLVDPWIFSEEKDSPREASDINQPQLARESRVFTGSDLDSELSNEIYSTKVFVPFRKLLSWQHGRGLSNWINLLHPQSWVSPSVQLGVDIFVGANSSIGSHTDVSDHVRINRNVSVGHHVKIGVGCEIAPMAAISSGAHVSNWVFIGAGAVILNNITIGENATIGAGTVVTRDVMPNETILGNPGRPRQH